MLAFRLQEKENCLVNATIGNSKRLIMNLIDSDEEMQDAIARVSILNRHDNERF